MADHIPYVGEKLYLSQHTKNYFVNAVKIPYTVSKILSPNEIEVRECKLIFNGPQYYDSMPDEIEEDLAGKVVKLRWNERRSAWCEYPLGDYPYYAKFGAWEYYPYLN